MSRRPTQARTGAPDELVQQILAGAPALADEDAAKILLECGVPFEAGAIVDLVDLVDAYSFNRAAELATPNATIYRDYFEAVRAAADRLGRQAFPSADKGIPAAVKVYGWARIETIIVQKMDGKLRRTELREAFKMLRSIARELRDEAATTIHCSTPERTAFEQLVGSTAEFCSKYARARTATSSVVTKFIWKLYQLLNEERNFAYSDSYFLEKLRDVESARKAVQRASRRLRAA